MENPSMTYQNSAELANDPDFQARLAACVATEAYTKPPDEFVDQLLRNAAWGAIAFGPTVAVAPGFGDKYANGGQESITDGDILSAVQASWGRIAALYLPPAP
jgi:hypothetical protein